MFSLLVDGVVVGLASGFSCSPPSYLVASAKLTWGSSLSIVLRLSVSLELLFASLLRERKWHLLAALRSTFTVITLSAAE